MPKRKHLVAVSLLMVFFVAQAVVAQVSFRQSWRYSVPEPTGTVVGDFNNDGNLDFAVASFCVHDVCPAGAAVYVFLGNGDGTFFRPRIYPSGGSGSVSLATADVNGDGNLDLVVGSAWCAADVSCRRAAVSVLLGNGDGTFQSARAYDAGLSNAQAVAISDVNGDGKLDIVVTGCTQVGYCCCEPDASGMTISLLLGNGNGTFQAATKVASLPRSSVYEPSIVVTDLNGDGNPDIVVPVRSGGVGVMLGNGDGTFKRMVTYPVEPNVSSVVVADVDGDGNPDILVAAGCTTTCNISLGAVWLLLGNGNGTFRHGVEYSSGACCDFSLAIGDVIGNGNLDVIVANGPANYPVIYTMLGDGKGDFRTGIPLTRKLSTEGALADRLVAVGDFNGDGKLDLVTDEANVFLNTTNGPMVQAFADFAEFWQ